MKKVYLRAEYGRQTLKNLSKKLTIEFGKGFSTDNLERMKRFYLVYVDSISANPLRKFSLYEGNDSIFASRYQTVLPNKQTFVNLLNTHIK